MGSIIASRANTSVSTRRMLISKQMAKKYSALPKRLFHDLETSFFPYDPHSCAQAV